MFKRIIVPLTETEFDAVDKLAVKERRRPEAQAAVLIRGELIRLGLIEETDESGNPPKGGNRERPTTL